MANVTVKTEVVETNTYILELTEHEARSLRLVIGSVAGFGPIRESLNSVFDAMPDSLRCTDYYEKFEDGRGTLVLSGEDF
jgi:hypothetical protein